MVFDLIFFLRNRFIFRNLNVAAKISFLKQKWRDFERKSPKEKGARLESDDFVLSP